MHFNYAKRNSKKRKQEVTQKISEANRTKPRITLPYVPIRSSEEEEEPNQKSQLRKRSKYDQ